jgi:hypothetical protein
MLFYPNWQKAKVPAWAWFTMGKAQGHVLKSKFIAANDEEK